MSNRHSKDCKFIRLPSQCSASWHHVREFSDVSGHLVTPTTLNFAVVLSIGRVEWLGLVWFGSDGIKRSHS